MSGSGRNGRIFWGAAITVLVVDVVTKVIAADKLFPPHVPHPIIGDVVRFTLAYNPGAAFSMSLGSASRWVFGAFAAIALIVLWRLYVAAAPNEKWKALSLGLAWGGAAGNLIDRIRSPLGVVDFIDIGVGSVRFWTFNVADSAVSVGAVMLGWILLQEDRQRKHVEAPPAPPASAAPPATSD